MTWSRTVPIAAMLALCAVGPAYAVCDDTTSVLDRACKHITDTWEQGDHELYVPFHTYHLRQAYTQEKINSFREDTWGIGYGRSRYDASGNWDGLYAMTFLDSHSKQEPMLGYGHEWMWGPREGLHSGVGYTVFLTARSDIGHYTPIPGILPIASVNYGKAAVNVTYVPGGEGHGNILFFWGRFGF
jgi:lipid IVA palmitoyltransferase